MPIYKINPPLKEKVVIALSLLIALVICIGTLYLSFSKGNIAPFHVFILTFGAIIIAIVHLRLYANVFGRLNLYRPKDDTFLIMSCFSLLVDALIILGYFFGGINDYCKMDMFVGLLLYIVIFGAVNLSIIAKFPIIAEIPAP